MSMKVNAKIASFGGKLLKLSHASKSTECDMNLNLYLPPQASESKKVPVLIYLAGLTCTGDNCAEKGFFQHKAAEKGIAVVYPDTSPRTSFCSVLLFSSSSRQIERFCCSLEKKVDSTADTHTFCVTGGLKIEGEDDAYDFGSGAGFYVDATTSPWSKGYKMYTYITSEMPSALFESFPQLDSSRVSITGHSMGGHGALTLYLKNPGMYKSCSAFAPIANPSKCPWGEKAFKGYFGEGEREGKWKEHDATELVKGWKGPLELLIDVGTGDNFYNQKQLLPENFVAAAKEAGNDKGIQLRFQPDYDHSYFFMATFADEHVEWAAKAFGL